MKYRDGMCKPVGFTTPNYMAHILEDNNPNLYMKVLLPSLGMFKTFRYYGQLWQGLEENITILVCSKSFWINNSTLVYTYCASRHKSPCHQHLLQKHGGCAGRSQWSWEQSDCPRHSWMTSVNRGTGHHCYADNSCPGYIPKWLNYFVLTSQIHGHNPKHIQNCAFGFKNILQQYKHICVNYILKYKHVFLS